MFRKKSQTQATELTIDEKSQLFIEHIVNGKQTAAEELLKSVSPTDQKALLTKSFTVKDPAGRTFEGVTALQYTVWALDNFMWDMLLPYLSVDEAKNQIESMANTSWVTQYQLHANWDALIAALQAYLDLVANNTTRRGTHPECYLSDDQKLRYINKIGEQQVLLPMNVIQQFCRPSNTTPGTRSEITTTKVSKAIGSRYADWYDNYRNPLLGPRITLGHGMAYFRGRRACPRWGGLSSIDPPSSYTTKDENGNVTVWDTVGKHYSLIASDIIGCKGLYDSRMEKYQALLQKLCVNFAAASAMFTLKN